MRMKTSALVVLVLVASGLACNLSGRPAPVPSPNPATQVSRLLTALPTPSSLAPRGSATAAATASAVPTPAPTATATPPATDPRLTLGKPDWRDTFQNGNNWDLSGGNPQATLSDGKLVFSVSQADGTDWWRLTAPKLGDFYLEGTATIGPCHGLDRYGLTFRAPSLTQLYLFGFSCDGRFSLRKWDGSHFTALEGWTTSSAIQAGPGQTNRLGLMAKGSRLSLYANGSLLAKADDSSYSQGRFGLFVASTATDNFSVAFSQLDYWTLP
jgi:hypothetical protein